MKSALIILALAFTIQAQGEVKPHELTQETLPPINISGEQVRIGKDFKFTVTPEDYHLLKGELGSLNEEELIRFKTQRRFILSQVARVFAFKNTRSGLGMIEGDKLTMVKDGVINEHPLDALVQADAEKKEVLNESQKVNRRHKLLLKLMTRIDNFIFQNANTTISSNEYGIDAAISLGSVIGARGKYIFGGSVGLQLTLGFNVKTKQIVFQLKGFSEVPTSGISGVFMPLGLTPRLGLYMRSSDKAPTSYDITYSPLAPAYLAKSNGMASIGTSHAITALAVLSGGLLSVVEAAMAYNSRTKTVTFVDSYALKEYVRIKFVNFQHSVNSFKTAYRPQPVVCGGSLFNL